jgi:hypothetical protein
VAHYEAIVPLTVGFGTTAAANPNREVTHQAQRAATECGVEVITAKQFWRLLAAACCTHYDVLALEDRRLASMRELPEALRRTLSI